MAIWARCQEDHRGSESNDERIFNQTTSGLTYPGDGLFTRRKGGIRKRHSGRNRDGCAGFLFSAGCQCGACNPGTRYAC